LILGGLPFISRDGGREDSRRAKQVSRRSRGRNLNYPHRVSGHLHAEFDASGERVGKRLAIREDPRPSPGEGDRPLPDDRARGAQRVLLLFDISRIVEQKPNESRELTSEDYGGVNRGVGNEIRMRGPRSDHRRSLRPSLAVTRETPSSACLSRHPGVPVLSPIA